MNAFTYRDDWLHAEDVSLAALAEQYGTPLLVYSGLLGVGPQVILGHQQLTTTIAPETGP
jgi:hypothetical protein